VISAYSSYKTIVKVAAAEEKLEFSFQQSVKDADLQMSVLTLLKPG
jgi:uncharacterized protein YktA (UPF0223 family)